MGSLGPPARAMAVRSASALFCFALLCGLAASSIQSETETDLTKEGEAAGDEVLVEQAVESRAARGAEKKNKITLLREKCKERGGEGNACKILKERTRGRKNSRKAKKSKSQRPKRKGQKKKGRNVKKKGGKKVKKNKGRNRKNKNKNKKKKKKKKKTPPPKKKKKKKKKKS